MYSEKHRYKYTNNLYCQAFSYLVEGVNLFSIGCEGHETCCQVDQAADHHVLLAEAGLLVADQVPSPHHVTVAVLHTAEKQ